MASLNVFALAGPAEIYFLEDYFSDTRSCFTALDPQVNFRVSQPSPDFLFLNFSLVTDKQLKNLRKLLDTGKTRIYGLGTDKHSAGADLPNIFQLTVPLSPVFFEEEILKPVEFPAEIRVLVIDDEPELCAGIKEYLESRRQPVFRVDYALNGLEAFHKIEQFRPDVTLLDLKMPVKSGHDFYRETQRRYPGFRVIVLTSSVGPDEIEEILKSGRPPFVEKGSRRSSFAELAALIKKTWAFS